MPLNLTKPTFLVATAFVALLGSLLTQSPASAQTIARSAACPRIEIIDRPRDFRRRAEYAWNHNDMDKNHYQPLLRQIKQERGPGGAADIQWMLTRVPNHHQALQTMIRYSFILKKKPRHIPLINAPECYLRQAMLFAPDDPMVRFLYGLYLHRLGQLKKAVELYRSGLELAPNSAEGNYNLGLCLFQMKRYDEALKHATLAYEFGHPLKGLARMLARKGYKMAPREKKKTPSAES